MQGKTDMYEMARERLNYLERQCNQIEKALNSLPEGKISIRKRKNIYQYYNRTNPSDTTGRYLSKKDISMIKKLLQKDYYHKLLDIFEKEKKAIEKMLLNAAMNPATFAPDILADTPITAIRNLYSSYPDQAKKYINPIDMSDEDYINSWLEMERNYKPVGNRTADYVTQNNELVRSKSEINIANALKKNGIPYKYEAELKLKGGAVIYPDFTILDVKNRREVYWEHRGMMDDREYCRDSVRRIKLYANNNLFPGDGLILSEETSATPLGTTDINDLIRHYL